MGTDPENKRRSSPGKHNSKTSTSIRGANGSHAPIFGEALPTEILKAEAVDIAGVGDLPIGVPAVSTPKGKSAREVYEPVAKALVPARI